MPFRVINPEARLTAAAPLQSARIDPPPRRRPSPPPPPSPAPAPAPNLDVSHASSAHASNRDANGDYIVGKGRPPTEHRFEKGRSGNPKGRPRGAKGVNTLVLEVFGAKQPVRTPQGQRRMNTPEIALLKMRELAAKGELGAIVAVLRHWTQAVPDLTQKTEGSPSVVLSAADQQLLDMLISGFGVVDDRIQPDRKEAQ